MDVQQEEGLDESGFTDSSSARDEMHQAGKDSLEGEFPPGCSMIYIPEGGRMQAPNVDQEGYLLDGKGNRVMVPVAPKPVLASPNTPAIRVDKEGFLLNKKGKRVMRSDTKKPVKPKKGQPTMVDPQRIIHLACAIETDQEPTLVYGGSIYRREPPPMHVTTTKHDRYDKKQLRKTAVERLTGKPVRLTRKDLPTKYTSLLDPPVMTKPQAEDFPSLADYKAALENYGHYIQERNKMMEKCLRQAVYRHGVAAKKEEASSSSSSSSSPNVQHDHVDKKRKALY